MHHSVVRCVYRELTPEYEELQDYKRAWARHLLAHAWAATGGDITLSEQAREDFASAVVLAVSSTCCAESEMDVRAGEDVISAFEAKYWPNVIIPLRQEVLRNMQEWAHLCQSENQERPSRPDSSQSSTMAPVAAATRGGSLQREHGGNASKDKHAAEDASDLFSSRGGASSAKVLWEVVARDLDAVTPGRSGVYQEVMKYIGEMKSQRIAKSAQVSVEFEDLEVTVSSAYQASECLRLEFAELYGEVTLYYDLRTSLAAAFEGVRIIDSLLPELSHRLVLSSQHPCECHWVFNEDASSNMPLGPRQRGHPAANRRLRLCAQSCPQLRPCLRTPASPVRCEDNPCILDWNSSCLWRTTSCPFDTPDNLSLKSQKPKEMSHDTRAGGWMRFEKVYIPLEGLPDFVFHMQTNGSLICTVSPAALAHLARILQEPVQLVEKNSILQAVSREVQKVIRRNELFMAKMLMGEVDNASYDICVCIPVPHQLLLPFNHKDPKSRGILLQSGSIFVDTNLQRPRVHPAAFCPANSKLAYDRYLATVTGACVRRVFNCLSLMRSSRKVHPTPPSSPASWSHATLPATATAYQCSTSSRTATVQWGKCRHCAISHATPLRQTAHYNTVKVASEDNSGRVLKPWADPPGKAMDGVGIGPKDFLVWPVNIVGCLDVCHFINPPSLPTFRLLIQDQAFK